MVYPAALWTYVPAGGIAVTGTGASLQAATSQAAQTNVYNSVQQAVSLVTKWESLSLSLSLSLSKRSEA